MIDKIEVYFIIIGAVLNDTYIYV